MVPLLYLALAIRPADPSWIQPAIIVCSIAHIPYLFALYSEQSRAQSWHKSGTTVAIVWLVALALRVPFLPVEPLFSDDLNRYVWEARQWSAGGNPYLTTPQATVADASRIPGPGDGAVYGPVLEAMGWIAYRAGHVKLGAVAADSLLLGALWWWVRRAGQPLWRWMLYGWSPLPAVEFWWHGHNDAWVLLALFSTLALATLPRRLLAWGAFIAAILTKWWPAMLLPYLWGSVPSVGGILLLSAAGAALFLALPWEFWKAKIDFSTGFLGGWQNNAFFYRFLESKFQAMVLLVGVALASYWWRNTPFRAALWLTTILVAFSANIHPWYLSWFLPLLAAEAINPLPWLLGAALTPLFYDSVLGWRVAGYWQEDSTLRVLVWGAVFIFGVVTYVRTRTR